MSTRMSATPMARPLTLVRAAEIVDPAPAMPAWLVEPLWGRGAVGVIGGAPKSCKSWLALELAVAVASGRPCLGRFAVPAPGPVMLYAAEDAPLHVRDRLEHLCQARGARFDTLDVHVIVENSLRIDRAEDVARLRHTLDRRRPRLLILDPYVRLQRADENNTTEVAAILATLRMLSRDFGVALLLVHHARKSSSESAGQGLRGSSDFHAWGDSNLYLRRRPRDIVLTVEHRAAAAPPHLTLALAENPPRLELSDSEHTDRPATALEQRLLAALASGPRRLAELRTEVSARKESVVAALHRLEAAGAAARHADGWALMQR